MGLDVFSTARSGLGALANHWAPLNPLLQALEASYPAMKTAWAVAFAGLSGVSVMTVLQLYFVRPIASYHRPKRKTTSRAGRQRKG